MVGNLEFGIGVSGFEKSPVASESCFWPWNSGPGCSILLSASGLGSQCRSPRLRDDLVLGYVIIGTLRGVGGRGVGDYTSLNRPY